MNIINNENEKLETLLKEIIKVSKSILCVDNENSYKKIENILYSYKKIEKAIIVKEETIKEIEVNGLPEKSTGIVLNNNNTNKKDKCEIQEEFIRRLKSEIIKNQNYLILINNAILSLEDKENISILKDKYIENENIEKLSIKYKRDKGTISRNIKKSINELNPILLSDTYIYNILYQNL